MRSGIILGIGSEISDISEKSFKKLFTHKGPRKKTFPMNFHKHN